MRNTTKVVINLAALRHNLKQVKQLTPDSKVVAVLKADAYGHGLIEVAKIFDQHSDGIAVARISEAIRLRNSSIQRRVLLLGSLLDASDILLCSEQSIDIVVHDSQTARLICASKITKPVNVWLKIDTGMHRLGLLAHEFNPVYQQLSNTRAVKEIIFMSHFSSADEISNDQTLIQLNQFKQITADYDNPVSLANSAALIKFPATHSDWVRPGIMLYGANPLYNNDPARSTLKLIPAMTLSACIVALRKIDAGESVGYNCLWTSQRTSLIATVGIGYGDGYPRHAVSGTPTLINGQRAPIVGTVSMDLISIDVTDCSNVNIGDDVILWGEQLPPEEIAACADTIPYELFTSITKRAGREYINMDDIP